MHDPSEFPIRILHVLGSMNRGGIEVWLMHILRHIDRERFRMDFVTSAAGSFDNEIRSHGSQVHRCASPGRLQAFRASLQSIIRKHGPYDVVHSHLHHFSGLVLWFAAQSGVPVRMAHCHNDQSAGPHKPGLIRRGYLNLTESLIDRYATGGLACSRPAAADLFGRRWTSDPRWRIHLYSMPFSQFDDCAAHSKTIRAELGIPPDAFVIGHVGRFAEQKNHSFLVDVFAAAHRRNPDLRLLLVGDGPLRPEIEQKVSRLNLADCVIFAGVRPDIPQLMGSAMDGFLFPSFHEGCSLALVEAQAAGLPSVVTDNMADEAIVVDRLIEQRALSDPIASWVAGIEAMPAAREAVSRDAALQTVAGSRFHVQRGVEELESIYLTDCGRDTSTADRQRPVSGKSLSRKFGSVV